MATIPTWNFIGGTTTIIQGLDDSKTEFLQWCDRVVEFILKISQSPDFELKDNGYRSFPGVLVTDGVTGLFRGKPFQIWSDVAGEIILKHESMGFRLGNELIGRLEALWSSNMSIQSALWLGPE
jgi:hypothetical protein